MGKKLVQIQDTIKSMNLNAFSPSSRDFMTDSKVALNIYEVTGGQKGFEMLLNLTDKAETVETLGTLQACALLMNVVDEVKPANHLDQKNVVLFKAAACLDKIAEEELVDDSTLITMEQIINSHMSNKKNALNHFTAKERNTAASFAPRLAIIQSYIQQTKNGNMPSAGRNNPSLDI